MAKDRSGASATVTVPRLIERLVDPARPFVLFFAVQERGLRRWAIDHGTPRPHHVVYLPGSDPIIGTLDGKPVRVDPGQVLWCQPFTVWHLGVQPATGTTNLGVFRFDLADDQILRLPESGLIGPVPPGDSSLTELLPGHEVGGGLDHLHHRVTIARMLCHAAGRMGGSGGEGLDADQRRRILDWITRNLHGRFSIAELAKVVDLNPQYLSRRFREAFGQAPKTWIMHLRIRHAASHLLMSGDSVAATAERFGYDQVFLFSRQFHAVMGCTPSAWRARGGSG